ncbi:MAG: hypothetical protein V1668_02935 [Patescibacteria group bacterium]
MIIKEYWCDNDVFETFRKVDKLNILYSLQTNGESILITTSQIKDQFYSNSKIISNSNEELNRTITNPVKYEYSVGIAELGHLFEDPDESLIFAAGSTHGVILSNDKKLRNRANRKNIETHGTQWVLKKLVERKIIDPETAYNIAKQMELLGERVGEVNRDYYTQIL